MKEPKLYELPPKDCWAMVDDQWVKAELTEISLCNGNHPYCIYLGKNEACWAEKITYENPTETRLPTRAELVELLKNNPQMRVKGIEGTAKKLWVLEGDYFNELNDIEFTLDLGETFHSFKRDWSEEL